MRLFREERRLFKGWSCGWSFALFRGWSGLGVSGWGLCRVARFLRLAVGVYAGLLLSRLVVCLG